MGFWLKHLIQIFCELQLLMYHFHIHITRWAYKWLWYYIALFVLVLFIFSSVISHNSILVSLPVSQPVCMKVMPIPTFKDLQFYFKTKVLTLRTGVKKYEMPGIANLLWSSPHLENLIIDLVPSKCIYVSTTKLVINFLLLLLFPCLQLISSFFKCFALLSYLFWS